MTTPSTSSVSNERLAAALARLDELFAVETRWTKGAGARNERGAEVSWSAAVACRWCLLGGMWYAATGDIDVVPGLIDLFNGVGETRFPERCPALGVTRRNDHEDFTYADLRAWIAAARAALETGNVRG